MPNATCVMTAKEFEYLKQHPDECPEHMAQEFKDTLAWERRSSSAKRAVETKRKKFKKWPGGRRKKETPPTPPRVAAKPFRFYYREDGTYSGDGEFRWWRSDWFGDQFDIINKDELMKRMQGATMCGLLVTKLECDEEPEDVA